ncbi:MAG: hypothetical protein ACRYFR_14610 [Janthinobacterium lividum]
MKKSLDDYRDEFGETAKQAQDIARTLGLGAIAAVWIFKYPDGAKGQPPATLLPPSLVWALLLAVLGLGLDLVQFVVKAVWLYAFYRIKEDKADARYKKERADALAHSRTAEEADAQATKVKEALTADVHAPKKMEWVTWTFFGMKMLLMLAAYVVLAKFLSTKF